MQQRLIRNKVGAGVRAIAGAVTSVAAEGTPSTQPAEAAEASRSIRDGIGGRASAPILAFGRSGGVGGSAGEL